MSFPWPKWRSPGKSACWLYVGRSSPHFLPALLLPLSTPHVRIFFRPIPHEQCMLRQDLRSFLRIRGTPARDFGASVCCTANVVAQETIELEEELNTMRLNALTSARGRASGAGAYPLQQMSVAAPPPAYEA